MAVAGLRRVAFPRVDRRVVVGVLLAALAAALVLATTRPPPTVPVLVAAADLPAGQPLTSADVSVRELASSRGLVAGDSLGELTGWSLAAPVGAGEPLLPSLLREPERLTQPSLFALAVDEEHAVLGRLAAGDLVDVIVTWDAPVGEAAVTELLADDVYVVEARRGDSTGSPAVQLLLAVDDELALRLATAVHAGEFDLVKVTP